jgi:hypothetical protein
MYKQTGTWWHMGFFAPFYMNALVGLQFLDIFGLKNEKTELVSSHQAAMA